MSNTEQDPYQCCDTYVKISNIEIAKYIVYKDLILGMTSMITDMTPAQKALVQKLREMDAEDQRLIKENEEQGALFVFQKLFLSEAMIKMFGTFFQVETL